MERIALYEPQKPDTTPFLWRADPGVCGDYLLRKCSGCLLSGPSSRKKHESLALARELLTSHLSNALSFAASFPVSR